VKDAAQDLAHDVAQEVTEGVLGTAEDGGVKVIIFSIAIFHPRPTHAHRPNTVRLQVVVSHGRGVGAAAERLAQQVDPRDEPRYHMPGVCPPHQLREPPEAHRDLHARALTRESHAALGRARGAHAQEPPPQAPRALLNTRALCRRRPRDDLRPVASTPTE